MHISLENYNGDYRVRIGPKLEKYIDTVEVSNTLGQALILRTTPMFYIDDISGRPENDRNARYLFKLILNQYLNV